MYPACNARAPCYHLWLAGLYNIFPHYLINDTIFEKKLTNIKCVFSVHFCLKHFTFSEEMSGILSKMYTGLHVKYPLFLSDFNKNLIFSQDFSKNTQISNFIKTRPAGGEVFHADGRTDGHDKANRRFLQYYERA
jgi:hypothetical protein